MRRRRAVLALSLGLCLAAPAAPALAEDDLPSEGQKAPSFQLRAMNPQESGREWVSLDRYVGEEPEDGESKGVLLSFFASWCGPCAKELPYLESLHQGYRAKGLRVISVNIDREEKGLADARKMLRSSKVTFPVLSDRFNLLARRYLGEQSPLPSVFFIRRDGTVEKIERGYGKDAKAFLLAEVQRLLAPATAEVRAAQ